MRIRINILEKRKQLLKEFGEFWYYVGKAKEYRYWFFESKWEEWGIKRLTKNRLKEMKENWDKLKKEWNELMREDENEEDK